MTKKTSMSNKTYYRLFNASIAMLVLAAVGIFVWLYTGYSMEYSREARIVSVVGMCVSAFGFIAFNILTLILSGTAGSNNAAEETVEGSVK